MLHTFFKFCYAAQVQDETNSSQPQQSEQPPPSSSSNDLGTSPQTEDSQLRSRFNRSEEETVSSLETQGEGSRSVQGDLINIRLISSGSTMTLQVRTDCTLDQLRRYVCVLVGMLLLHCM